jgi:cytoskeletal protein CcmA (bactofilin family)
MASTNGAYISRGITLRGRVQGNGEVVVEGAIEGSVSLSQALVVEAGGTVDAEVDAPEIQVRGRLSGSARASELLLIGAEGTATGRLRSPRLVIEDGAQVTATFDMDVELPAGMQIPEGLDDEG